MERALLNHFGDVREEARRGSSGENRLRFVPSQRWVPPEAIITFRGPERKGAS